MRLRPIPLEFKVDTDSGVVFFRGQRLFIVPVANEGYTSLQNEVAAGLLDSLAK